MAGASRVWIGAGWKMNKTLAEALRFAEPLAATPPPDGIRRFVLPPFTALREVASALGNRPIEAACLGVI